jgi:hypothetical protein
MTFMEINMSNITALVDDFAAIDAQVKELTKQRDAIKKQLLEVAVFMANDKMIESATFGGTKADVVITKTFPTTFSKDLAQTLLSAEDFVRCHATAIKPTLTPRVVAKSPAFA